ncbi:MAG: hypothetical protein LUM44_07575 [Pyrinomonadaceae bacterium]|nr:hypothetical protein [Pyrinomonadaceae bacterium]
MPKQNEIFRQCVETAKEEINNDLKNAIRQNPVIAESLRKEIQKSISAKFQGKNFSSQKEKNLFIQNTKSQLIQEFSVNLVGAQIQKITARTEMRKQYFINRHKGSEQGFLKLCSERIDALDFTEIIRKEVSSGFPANEVIAIVNVETDKQASGFPVQTPIPLSSPGPSETPSPSPLPTEKTNVNSTAAATPATFPSPKKTILPFPPVTVAGKVSPPEMPREIDYLTPGLAISAVLFSLILASFLAKHLFDKWKYGKNALNNLHGLKKAIGVKNELTEKWLKKRRSANIHAIGIGKIDGTDEYCIQVFVENANGEMLEDPPTQLLPERYQNLPIFIYEMPRADFLSFRVNLEDDFSDESRQPHEILKGGISGANANLANDFGTIGYFFRPNFIDSAAHIFLKKHVYLLSNSHVFVDLTKEGKDDSDLILHPSPGDPAASKAVAELYDYAPIIFGGDVEKPNFVDAAIAKLFRGQTHSKEIARIGKVEDYLSKEQVELRSNCQKVGRTTGLTRGRIFSIHLSIWVKYSAKGKEAFFKDQFLIIPTDNSSFVRGGDSGSLVVNDANKAVGLIFAGASEKTAFQFPDIEEALDLENILAAQTPRIEHFGVANSISDVMKTFRIKLDV